MNAFDTDGPAPVFWQSLSVHDNGLKIFLQWDSPPEQREAAHPRRSRAGTAALGQEQPLYGRIELSCTNKSGLCTFIIFRRPVVAYEIGMSIIFDVITKSILVTFRGDFTTLPGPYRSRTQGIATGEEFCRKAGWLDEPSKAD